MARATLLQRDKIALTLPDRISKLRASRKGLGLARLQQVLLVVGRSPSMIPSSWGKTVGTAVGLQWALVGILALAVWIFFGRIGALSLFCGGSAVALPNTVLALWLTLRVMQTGSAGTTAMLLGELLKIGLTIAMLVMVVGRLKPEISWPALLVGVFVALKAQWLALWFTRRPW